jgi:hypothetical protein
MLREGGASSTPRLIGSITLVSDYWVTRRSLSSGAHSRDPLAGDDSVRWDDRAYLYSRSVHHGK